VLVERQQAAFVIAGDAAHEVADVAESGTSSCLMSRSSFPCSSS